MRLLFKVCVAAAVVALVVGPALAQRPQRPGGGGGFGFGQMDLQTLLANKSVQEEIKADKDQIAKITEAVTKFREEHKDDYAKLRNRETSREERAELGRKLGEKFTTAAKDLIKPEQMKRIKQIQLQLQARGGPAVFASEEVQKELKFTDEQKDKIKTIADDLRKDTADLGFNQEGFTKRRELTTEASEKVQKVLTEEQKKAWKELTGAPFEIRIERPARPGGAGGDRPNPPATQGTPKKIDF